MARQPKAAVRSKRPPAKSKRAPRSAVATLTPAAARRRRPAAEAPRPGAVRRIAGVVRQHPIASVVTVLVAGALLTWVVRSRGRWRPMLAAAPPLRLPDFGPLLSQLTPQLEPIVKRIGVAGMKVSTDLAGGAHRKFGVRWKRRPADAPEESWPTDEVELDNRRADGGRTGFELTWKTLPADSVPDAAPRYPGDSQLGETSLELETKRPDGRTTGMGFTWRKLPAGRRSPVGTPGQGR